MVRNVLSAIVGVSLVAVSASASAQAPVDTSASVAPAAVVAVDSSAAAPRDTIAAIASPASHSIVRAPLRAVKSLRRLIPPMPSPHGASEGVKLMIFGGAALLTGAVIGGDAGGIIMVGGAVVGLYGLWVYLN